MDPANTVIGTEDAGVNKADKVPVPIKIIFYDVRQAIKKKTGN